MWPSDATYVVEWKPALKCVNARLIFLTLTINAIKKINCSAALHFIDKLSNDTVPNHAFITTNHQSLLIYNRTKIAG